MIPNEYSENAELHAFRNNFATEAEAARETQERAQTEKLLHTLESIQAQREADALRTKLRRRRSRRRSREREHDSDSDSDLSGYEEEERPRRRRVERMRGKKKRGHRRYFSSQERDAYDLYLQQQRSLRPDREYMGGYNSDSDSESEDKRKKIHTLADLPRDDDFDWLPPSSSVSGPFTEVPEVKVRMGRRLADGKPMYSTSLPVISATTGVDTGEWMLPLETIFFLVVAFILFAFFLGSRLSRRRAQQVLKSERAKHRSEIVGLRNDMQLMKQQLAKAQHSHAWAPFPPHSLGFSNFQT
jgi:hypothetical protein